MDGVDINRLQLQCLFRSISESEEGRDMRIYEVEDRSPELMEALLAVWESSVRATHLFLSDSEIHSIKRKRSQNFELQNTEHEEVVFRNLILNQTKTKTILLNRI